MVRTDCTLFFVGFCTAISVFSGFLMVGTEATVDLEITLVRYRNPSSLACNGGDCDLFSGTCDNLFTFCLRAAGTSACTYEVSSTDGITDDDFLFTSSILSQIGLSNPTEFRNIAPTAPLELEVRIDDDDGITSFDDHVDTIIVDFPRTLTLSTTFSPTASYQGTCRTSDRSVIDLQYRITSNCLENRYGLNCQTTCIPQVDQYYCNYLGDRVCQGNYYGTDCSVLCMATSEQFCNEAGVLVDRPSAQATAPSTVIIAIGVSVPTGILIIISVCVVCCCCCHYKKRHSSHRTTAPIAHTVQPTTTTVITTTATAQPTHTEYPMKAYPTAPQKQGQPYSAQPSVPQHDFSTLQGGAYHTQPQSGYSAQPSSPYPTLQQQPSSPYHTLQHHPPAPYQSMPPAARYPPFPQPSQFNSGYPPQPCIN